MRPKEGILSWCCGLVLAKVRHRGGRRLRSHRCRLWRPSTGVKWIERGSNHANRKTYELIDDNTLAELGVPRDPSELLAASIFLRDLPAAGRIPADVRRNRDSD